MCVYDQGSEPRVLPNFSSFLRQAEVACGAYAIAGASAHGLARWDSNSLEEFKLTAT